MSASNEVMTKEEAFDVYVRRRVAERDERIAQIWSEHQAAEDGILCEVSSHPLPLDRDVELRAIQLGIGLTCDENRVAGITNGLTDKMVEESIALFGLKGEKENGDT